MNTLHACRKAVWLLVLLVTFPCGCKSPIDSQHTAIEPRLWQDKAAEEALNTALGPDHEVNILRWENGTLEGFVALTQADGQFERRPVNLSGETGMLTIILAKDESLETGSHRCTIRVKTTSNDNSLSRTLAEGTVDLSTRAGGASSSGNTMTRFHRASVRKGGEVSEWLEITFVPDPKTEA